MKPDGTYETTLMSYEDTGEDADGDGVLAEAWVPVSGSRGSYTWDGKECFMEWTETAELVAGEWVAVSEPVTYSRGYFLTDQKYGIAWQFSGDVNEIYDTFTTTYADGTSEVEETCLQWGESGSTSVRIVEKYQELDADQNVTYESLLQRDGELVRRRLYLHT